MKLRILAAALACAVLGHAPALAQTTLLPPGQQCFQATSGLNGMVGTLDTLTGGSGYVNGTYGGVALTGGSGSGATANITVSGGVVSSVAILNPGTQYVVGDFLSAIATTIGGSGAGFSVRINSVSINSSLAGGTAAYYLPNTLTFKTTWKNSTQTIPNTNPVRLDQNGCATVYGLGSYRQIVKDSLGNTVWDALTASTAALSTNPASSGSGDFLAIGSIIPIAAFSAPVNYVMSYGQAISRSTYPDALTALTISSPASCVSSSTTISGITATLQMRVGAPIESSCLPPGTTIATIAGSTSITVSAPAVSTVSTTIRVFPWGNGDGSLTFNVPDLRGRVLPGQDCMGGVCASVLTPTYYGVNPGTPAATGGADHSTIAQSNLPAYTLPNTLGWAQDSGTGSSNRSGLDPAGHETTVTASGAIIVPTNAAYAAQTISTTTAGHITGSVTSGGSGTGISRIPPSLTINYAIKVLNGTLPTVGVLSLGGMTGDILCGVGLICGGSTISSLYDPANVAITGGNITGTTFTVGTITASNVSTSTWTGGSIAGAAISGGSVTGLPNPSSSSDAATKGYVDASVSGVIVYPSSRLATNAVLPNLPTYSNGASGVGATLTAGSNSTLTVDATIANLGDVILVRNQASAFQNGIYTVTNAGSGAAPWVLTRATYFDQAAEMLASSYTYITGGTVNVNTAWILFNTVTTVGTDPLQFNLYSNFPNFWASSGLDVYRASGNVGIGGVPSAWDGSFEVMQIASGSFSRNSTDLASVHGNLYFDGTNWKYINNGTGANLHVNSSGGLLLNTAVAGTAGANATMNTRMAVSNLGVMTLGAYGAGVATFDSSGIVSSKKAYTTSVTYCADLGVVANTGADQTAALQSCANTACVGGANTIMQMPGGVIKISNEITIGDVSCIIMGTGMTDLAGFLGYSPITNAGTRIDQMTLNKNTFHHVGANAPQFRDFTVTSPMSGPPTSGACIYSEVPNPALAVSSIGLMINRVACIGGAYCWVLSEAGNAVVESSTCWGPQIYGLYNFTHTCPPQPCIDSGDSTFRDLRFISAGQPCVASIRIAPGGGLMMSAIKFLGCDNSVYVSAAGGNTGTIMLTGSSVEQSLVTGFKVDDPTPGPGIGLGQFTISNNEFLVGNTPGFQSAIEFVTSASNYLDRFNIVGNTIGIGCCSVGLPSFTAVCMEIEAGRLGVIADNVCEMFDTPTYGGIHVVGVAARVAVTNNSLSGILAPSTKYLFTVPTNFSDVGSLLTTGQLPANSTPGSYAAVTDGNSPSNPCTGGGTGTGAIALAGGVWKCQ